MIESEKIPERRIRELARKPDPSPIGRIRLGSSVPRGAYPPPAKINRFRLTVPPASTKRGRTYCPVCMAYEGSKHLGSHSYWRRLTAALARYAR